MREITITLYRFDELDEKAKQTARYEFGCHFGRRAAKDDKALMLYEYVKNGNMFVNEEGLYSRVSKVCVTR